MDTLEITKFVGAACGSLLVFMLIQTGSHALHSTGGHGEDHHNAYVIEVEEEVAEEVEVVEVDFSEVYASADAASGERQFRACAACHKLEDGVNGVGPHLYGVVGRDIGAEGGFAYSDALSGMGDAWTPENLNAFLENPSGWAPGTKMSYRGLSGIENRANLIAYLESIGG